MNQCLDTLKEICEILCDDINSELCEEIKNHLESCPKCNAYVDSIKKTIHLIQKVESDDDIPEDTRSRLFEALKLKTCE